MKLVKSGEVDMLEHLVLEEERKRMMNFRFDDLEESSALDEYDFQPKYGPNQTNKELFLMIKK